MPSLSSLLFSRPGLILLMCLEEVRAAATRLSGRPRVELWCTPISAIWIENFNFDANPSLQFYVLTFLLRDLPNIPGLLGLRMFATESPWERICDQSDKVRKFFYLTLIWLRQRFDFDLTIIGIFLIWLGQDSQFSGFDFDKDFDKEPTKERSVRVPRRTRTPIRTF